MPDKRYTLVAIILHWVMAVAFLLMLGSGLAFDNIPMEKSFKFQLYQWHKSLGVLLIILFCIRIGWRLCHKPPALPSSFKKLDVIASKIGHWALYVMMIVMPISGWIMVSSSVYGLPTVVFGWFDWPHIPGLTGDQAINDLSKTIHWIGGWIFLVFIAGHIAAIIKHILIDKHNLLPRMGIGKDNV